MVQSGSNRKEVKKKYMINEIRNVLLIIALIMLILCVAEDVGEAVTV
jgi:hypothetical protein